MDTPEPANTSNSTKTCPKCGKAVESWAKICPDCLFEWPEGDESLSPEEQEEVQAVAVFQADLERKGADPLVVYVLVALNILVFIVMALAGVSPFKPVPLDLFRWGANFGPATVQGQWWRLLTSTFIHIGALHLAFNMYVLWVGGHWMERILGHLGFTITYFLSGLLGSVATLAFHPDAVGAGASGAIFGIFGALLGFLVRDRSSIPRPVFTAMGKSTLLFLGYNLVYSLKPGVDLSAHLAGLVAGFLCGLVLSRPVSEEEAPGRLRLHGATFSAGLLIVGFLAAGVVKINGDSLSGGASSLENAGVAEEMKKILQDHFNSRADCTGVKVRQVRIHHHDGNTYTGTVRLWWIDREVVLSLAFKMDGDNVSWNLGPDPGRRANP